MKSVTLLVLKEKSHCYSLRFLRKAPTKNYPACKSAACKTFQQCQVGTVVLLVLFVPTRYFRIFEVISEVFFEFLSFERGEDLCRSRLVSALPFCTSPLL